MRAILISVFLAASTCPLLAQSAPLKMGLWEKKMITTGVSGAPGTLMAKSCITPATWQEMVSNASKQRPGCTVNVVKNAHGYIFNGSCTMSHGNSMVMSGSTTIQDSEHIVAESHSTMTINGRPRKIDTHSTSRFVSSDCGTVKPGNPEIEDK